MLSGIKENLTAPSGVIESKLKQIDSL